MNEETLKKVNNVISILNDDERLLLKDTIKHGFWGDCDYEFIDNNDIVTVSCYCYCTNDAKDGKHFSGRKISGMFRSIYNKLCPKQNNRIGEYISHENDWWGDGSGDVLFVREDYVNALNEWSKQ